MFSGIVKIADIDDYITPSQNCVKPLIDKAMNKVAENESKPNLNGSQIKAKITIEDSLNPPEEYINFNQVDINTNIKPDLIKIKDKSTKSAKVSLNDCLACNGCVTTAETILIQAQSVDEFLKNTLNSQITKDKISVVCVSPQTILSLSEYYQLTTEKTFKLFCHFLKKIGVEYVFNFNTAIMLSLTASYEEFKRRIVEMKENFMMCSECPGWICYAEKKVGEWIIPYTSKVKSPQQILGHLIKKMFREKLNINYDVYLTCIMPCYDKKLEATRESHKYKEFLEVDCVISTIELPELFFKMDFDFSENILDDENVSSSYNLDNFYTITKLLKISNENYNDNLNLFFSTQENLSSNGYAEFILNEYIKEFLIDKNYKIERKLGKNSDYKEIFLYVGNEGLPVLSFCIIYGFRNIQNILRLKNKIKYSYIEIMACPGGCINGGGQMRPKTQTESARDVLKRIEENVKTSLKHETSLDVRKQNIENEILYLMKSLNEEERREIFEANFKALDKQSLLNLKW